MFVFYIRLLVFRKGHTVRDMLRKIFPGQGAILEGEGSLAAYIDFFRGFYGAVMIVDHGLLDAVGVVQKFFQINIFLKNSVFQRDSPPCPPDSKKPPIRR